MFLVEIEGGSLANILNVSWDFIQRFTYEYNDRREVVQTVRTKLDGESPLFTTSYLYDDQGRMIEARIWDHRSEEEGQILRFSEHDEHGNWQRKAISSQGEISSIVLRHIVYRSDQ